MTDQPASGDQPARPEPAADTPPTDTPPEPSRAPGAGTLALLAVAWLLAMLTSARFTIGDSPQVTALTLTRTALEFPQVISASLVAGVAVGLAAVNLLSRPFRSVLVRPLRRVLVSAGGGLVLGAGLGAAIMIGYGSLPTIGTIVAAVATAGVLGGLLAGVRQRAVVAAGVTGALGVFAVRLVLGIFDVDLRTFFGAGDTAESVLNASNWVVLAGALIAGALAGALAYAYLRRGGPAQLTWPGYLLAGALPGLLALLAEVVTQIGGARLFQLVGQASVEDQVVQQFLTVTRFNQALVVLFTGALVAIVLLGRTLKPADNSDGPEPATHASS
jgi:hypothetical protein